MLCNTCTVHTMTDLYVLVDLALSCSTGVFFSGECATASDERQNNNNNLIFVMRRFHTYMNSKCSPAHNRTTN